MNKRIHKLLIVALGAGLILSLGACKSSRKLIIQPLKEQGPEYLFEQMKKNELKFNTFSAKFTAETQIDKNSTTISGIIYIERDSLIWLTVSKFGIEVARFRITPDSAKMINRMNDTYFLGEFDYVCKLFNVDIDFDMLQSLVLGNDFAYYDNDVFKASVDNKLYKLSTIGRRKLKKFVDQNPDDQRVLIQDLWLDPETFKIIKTSIREVKEENRKLEGAYSNFEQIGEQRFPYSAVYEISQEKTKIKLEINFNRITLDEYENRGFNIPVGFQRVQ